MLKELAFYPIFHTPLIVYMGILTFTSFLFTALIGFLNYRGITRIPFKWHPRMAAFSICLAILHGLLGILAYF